MAGKKSTATMELAIGATIIAGVLILIVMLMAWGNSTSILGSHYRVVVNMANVGGLKEGAPVKMGGFQIGSVATIQLKRGSTEMEIVLDIDENIILPKSSTAKVATAGLVGDAFMEIVPGKSSEYLRRATSLADAEHIESSPLPDMSELMTKVNNFGEQLNILTANLNDIVGDLQFRKSLKSMAVNIDNVSYQANLILQRTQTVFDDIEHAAQNISAITDSAKGTVENLDAGITDARNALASTLGNPEVAKNIAGAIANINSVTDLLAKRNSSTEELIDNLAALSGDMKAVAAQVRAITGDIDLGGGGAKTKYNRNIEAIRLLQTIERESRYATPDEQQILALYSGWGGS